MRRRRSGILLAFAVVLFLLVGYLLSFLGGGAVTVDEPAEDPGRLDLPTPTPDEAPGPVAPAVVAGTVEDHDGTPIPGAKVWVVLLDEKRGRREEIELETDAEGRFERVDPPRGKILLVEVVKEGYPPVMIRHPENSTLRSGRTVSFDVVAPETFELAGHVKAFGGAPVVGARVTFHGYFDADGTDESGRFRIEGIPSGILRDRKPRLKCTCAGFQDRIVDLKLAGRYAIFDDLEIVMEPR